MNAASDAASKEAGQATGNPENSIIGNKGKGTMLTEASVNMEAQFSPAMLLQMKALVEGVVEGAVEKRLHTLGVNPQNTDPLGETQEGGGSKNTPAMHKQKPMHQGITQELVSKLPPIAAEEEEGFFTDWESPNEEGPEELEENLNENTDNIWAKKCAQQQEQMKLLAKEVKRLKEQKQATERVSKETEASEKEIHNPNEEGNPKPFSNNRSGGNKSELFPLYIDENSPFSVDIQTDPVPSNFKTISCEYQGKGDPEEHLMKFESLCLLHQYSEGVKCRVFLTTLSGTAQH